MWAPRRIGMPQALDARNTRDHTDGFVSPGAFLWPVSAMTLPTGSLGGRPREAPGHSSRQPGNGEGPRARLIILGGAPHASPLSAGPYILRRDGLNRVFNRLTSVQAIARPHDHAGGDPTNALPRMEGYWRSALEDAREVE
jgi:hypothetical protein